jgi:Trypsin
VWVAPLWIAGVLAAGCSAPLEFPIGVEELAVEGGEIDEANSAVFSVFSRTEGGTGLCTATLIAPNLMLTARHCVAVTTSTENVDCQVDRFLATFEPQSLKFSNATTPEWDDRWFSSQRVLVEETEDGACGHDIGLVILKESVPPQVAVPLEPRLDAQPERNEPYVAVGYGQDDVDPRAAESGTRHFRVGQSIACVGTTCVSPVAATEFQGSQGVCNGDSGGPALDLEGRVIGLLSRGGEGCSSPVYSAVAGFRTLLIEAAVAASDLSGEPLPVWAGGPAPSAAPDAARPRPTAEADAGAIEPALNDGALREASCSVAPTGSGHPFSARSGASLGFLMLAALCSARRLAGARS